MAKKAPQYYRHFKGGVYRLLHIAKDSECPERELVVYQALYGGHSVWVRPKDMFFSEVERDGYKGPRFVPISEEEAIGGADSLAEARRQIDSTVNKLKGTLETLESKDNPSRYKSQITLASRRIEAFTLASELITEKMTDE